MHRINSFDFDTFGGLKTVEIWNGDILEFERETDLLIISAFERGYTPTEGTLIGELAVRNINIQNMVSKPLIDLRPSLNTVLCHPLPDSRFRQIAVFEMLSANYFKSSKSGLTEIFNNLLISLEVFERKGQVFKSIIMPLLGTGNQGLSVAEIAAILPEVTESFFISLKNLQYIAFIDRNDDKVNILSNNINKKLGRSELELVKNNFATETRLEIIRKLGELNRGAHFSHSLLNEAVATLSTEKAKAWEIAVTGRKILELILNRTSGTVNGTLLDKIRMLETIPIARWTQSYMHLLRVFGNEMAHIKEENRTVPLNFSPEDLLLHLICIDRVLQFALDYENLTSSLNKT